MMSRALVWRRVAAVSGAALVVGALAVPAIADGATVTRGTFTVLAGAEGRPEADLSGRGQAVRTPSGKTHLSVRVAGLQPGVTYGVHLHNAPCEAGNPGGGHYKHDPAGPGQPPNELWPSSTPHSPTAGITANEAGIATGRGTADWIAGDNAVSVVLHAGLGHGSETTAGGPKLACADLE